MPTKMPYFLTATEEKRAAKKRAAAREARAAAEAAGDAPPKPKPKPNRRRRKAATTATMLDRARSTAAMAVDSLDECVVRAGRMLADPDEEYDVRLASHLAYLTKHAVMLISELRKLESHDQRAVQAMTPEERDAQVLEYVRSMPRDRRLAIRQALDELDAEQLLA